MASVFHRLGLRRSGPADPYEGADLEQATRLGGVVWLLGTIMAAGLLAAAPPTEAVGSAGWAVVGLLLVLSLAAAVALIARRGRVSFAWLLAAGYVTLGQVAVAEWLAGGHPSPYRQLFLLCVLYTAAVHPISRVLPYLAVTVLAVSAPLAYAGWEATESADRFAQLFLLCIVALVTSLLMAEVRRQRVTLRRHGEQAQQLALLDALTGLENRRAFDLALPAEIGRARRHDQPLVLLLADADHFKQLNDRLGHPEGDRCLQALAGALRTASRGGDRAFRWGGDEFALLLPGATITDADAVAGRAAEALAATPHPVPFTVGAAELRPGWTAEEMMAGADAQLLAAKGSRSATGGARQTA